MRKRGAKKILSLLLLCSMLLEFLPAIVQPVHAATNLATGFEGQDADIFTALGFDTSVEPEGYDPDTTENPYGRDKLVGNQVFELLTASKKGTRAYGKDNNNVSPDTISGVPNSGSTVPLEMFAVASGDFDGDGLNGEAIYVGYKTVGYLPSTQLDQYSNSKLYLCIYDGKTDTYSGEKEIGKVSPFSTVPIEWPWKGHKMATVDYGWQNLLQVTTGDFDGDGTSEIAVYVGENGKSRVDIYKYQKTSHSGPNDWRNLANWSRVWSYALNNTSGAVPNMVSLCAGDFNRDGVDDLAISSGRVAFEHGGNLETSNYQVHSMESSRATILWGGKSNMLQTSFPLDLNTSELGEQVRVSLITGDLNGDGYKELIATGHPRSDMEIFYHFESPYPPQQMQSIYRGNAERTIITYIYDETRGLIIDSSSLHKPIHGEYEEVANPTNPDGPPIRQWRSGNGFDQYNYSLPLMRTNAAVIRPEGQDSRYLYLDSCLYKYTEGQLTLAMSLDDEKYDGSNSLNVNWGPQKMGSDDKLKKKWFCEYGAVSGDIHGKGYSILATNFYRADIYTYSNALKHFTAYEVLYGTSNGALKANLTQDDQTKDKPYSDTLNTTALVFADVDMDTILIEYSGIHYLTYSDPKVLAIIAAAPYFKDVDVISDYDYAWQNTTSYSRLNGAGRGQLVTVDLEAGAYYSLGIESGGGRFELEASVNFTLEWEKETSKSTEYELSFETSHVECVVLITRNI